MNDLSEQAQCHMNTFANTKFEKDQLQQELSDKMIDEAAEGGSNQVDQLGGVGFAEREESSHLGSELDTYQCVMTPAAASKRRRRF